MFGCRRRRSVPFHFDSRADVLLPPTPSPRPFELRSARATLNVTRLTRFSHDRSPRSIDRRAIYRAPGNVFTARVPQNVSAVSLASVIAPRDIDSLASVYLKSL